MVLSLPVSIGLPEPRMKPSVDDYTKTVTRPLTRTPG
jgi:hypothetical protein